MEGDKEKDPRILAILTLEHHQNGIWIQRLVAALQQLVPAEIQIQVQVLEKYLQGPRCVSKPNPCHWIGLVNRVSDAAEPWLVKATLAVLQLAKHVWKIPIWNGPDSYSLCTHKWCHHVLFAQAGLESPDTVASLNLPLENNLESKCLNMLQNMLEPGGSTGPGTLEYLIKPNAGGFGAGIERRKAELRVDDSGGDANVSVSGEDLPAYSDKIVVLQKYILPRDGKIYRVWFLAGKVQCAVERTVDIPDPGTETNNSEFTSGCVAGVCSLPKRKPTTNPPNIHNWSVPDDVTNEIEQQLMPVLPNDCHCGSVEFLCSEGRQRMYFDLNLLSTLPVDESTSDQEDPWMELGRAIWSHMEQLSINE